MESTEMIQLIRSGTLGRDRVMEYLYRDENLRGNTIKYILHKGGTKEEAETIFNDAIINFVKQCYRPDFFIRSTVENYFFGVTRNLWFHTLRMKRPTEDLDEAPEIPDQGDPEVLIIDRENSELLLELLDELDEKCKKVLLMWAKNMKMKLIAEKMEYSSPEVARKKKHFCLKKLIKIVDQHPEYQKLNYR